jgi:hypothetical protein
MSMSFQPNSLSRVQTLKITNALGYVVLIVVNVLGSMNMLGGKSIGEVSGSYSTPLTPPSWTFGIWWLIFALQGLWVAYQLIPVSETKIKSELISSVGLDMFLGWVGEIGWHFAFSREYMALALFFGVWSCSYFFAAHCRMCRSSCTSFGLGEVLGTMALAMNAAWLALAVCMQLLVLQKAETGRHPSHWLAVFLIAKVACMGVCYTMRCGDPVVAVTLLWGCVGIHASQNTNAGSYTTFTACASAVFLAVAAISTGLSDFSDKFLITEAERKEVENMPPPCEKRLPEYEKTSLMA